MFHPNHAAPLFLEGPENGEKIGVLGVERSKSAIIDVQVLQGWIEKAKAKFR